jgi:hypothetical protein
MESHRALLLVLTGLRSAGQAPAQAPDQGVLEIHIGGKEAGREEFRVVASRPGRAGGDSIVATARYPASHPIVEFQASLDRLRSEASSFQLNRKATDGALQAYVNVTRTRITVRTVGQGTESAREFPGAERVAILDDSVFATWLAFERFATPDGQRVTALYPRTGRRANLMVSRSPDPDDRGTKGEVIRFQGDLTGALHLDDQGHFLRLELPGREVEVERLHN